MGKDVLALSSSTHRRSIFGENEITFNSYKIKRADAIGQLRISVNNLEKYRQRVKDLLLFYEFCNGK